MVSTVHTNHFYEMLAQISDPKIEFSMNTEFLKNDHVRKFGKSCFWQEKSPCRVAPQQHKGFRHILAYPQSEWDQITFKNVFFTANLLKICDFAQKSSKPFIFFAIQSLAGYWPAKSLILTALAMPTTKQRPMTSSSVLRYERLKLPSLNNRQS